MELYKIEDTILAIIRDRRRNPGTARISLISGRSRNPSFHPAGLIISSSPALGISAEGNSQRSLTR